MSRDGEAMLRRPCCEGAGEHQDQPSNNPMAMNHNCRTCEGMGNIKPSRFQEKTLHIHGRRESESAADSSRKVVELAHLTLNNPGPESSMEKPDWPKVHRKLMSSATRQEDEEGYHRKHPSGRRPVRRPVRACGRSTSPRLG